MPSASETVIAGPRFQLQPFIYGCVAVVFGLTLLVAAKRENKILYAIAGGGAIVVGIPFFLQYKQTVVNTEDGTWVRKCGGLFGTKTESGTIDEIACIGVRQGKDTKGKDCWAVTLGRNQGNEINWHTYTYLGRAAMEKDVARLQTALGVPTNWTADES